MSSRLEGQAQAEGGVLRELVGGSGGGGPSPPGHGWPTAHLYSALCSWCRWPSVAGPVSCLLFESLDACCTLPVAAIPLTCCHPARTPACSAFAGGGDARMPAYKIAMVLGIGGAAWWWWSSQKEVAQKQGGLHGQGWLAAALMGQHTDEHPTCSQQPTNFSAGACPAPRSPQRRLWTSLERMERRRRMARAFNRACRCARTGRPSQAHAEQPQLGRRLQCHVLGTAV